MATSRSKVAVQTGTYGMLLRSWLGPIRCSPGQVGPSTWPNPVCPAATTSVVRYLHQPSLPSFDTVNRRHVGQIQPAIRAHCRRRSQLRNPPVHGTQNTPIHVYIHSRPRQPNRPLNHTQLTLNSSSALLLPRPVPSHPNGQPPPLPLLPPSSPPVPPHGTTTSSVVRPTP